MIRLIGMNLMVLITLIAGGASKFLCDEDDTVSAPEPIDAQEAYVDSTTFGTCSQTFWVETRIVSGDTALSFVLTLINENDSGIVAMGDQVVLTPNWYCDTTFTLSVSYWDNITPGNYRLVLLIYDASKSSNKNDLDIRERLFAREVEWVLVQDWSGAGCPALPSDTINCVCHPSTLDPPRYHAFFQQRAQGITGIGGTFLPIIGELCCSGLSTAPGLSATFACLLGPRDTTLLYNLAWGQVGYRNERALGQGQSVQSEYLECAGYNYQYRFIENSLAPGFPYDYECYLDTIQGTWSFVRDGLPVNWPPEQGGPIVTDQYWVLRSGTRAYYACEVINKEDNISGTFEAPCTIGNCRTGFEGGGLHAIGYATGDTLHSDSTSEWIAERPDAASLQFWDANPD